GAADAIGWQLLMLWRNVRGSAFLSLQDARHVVAGQAGVARGLGATARGAQWEHSTEAEVVGDGKQLEGVDMPRAMKTAFDLSKEAALFDRPLGVLGVWGPLIHQWLEVLLPDDAATRCRHRVHVTVLELRRIVPVALPVFVMNQRVMVEDFQNKSELIASCMASVHIPWVIDGSPTTKLQGHDCIDGSIGGAREYIEDCFPTRAKMWLDPEDDPAMVGRQAQLLSLTGGDQDDEGLEKAERAWNWVSPIPLWTAPTLNMPPTHTIL
ncbi:hypothetical protein CYMTET_51235, partial [Cymbomonas tetramitiformis]